jgi:hypothetical protein
VPSKILNANRPEEKIQRLSLSAPCDLKKPLSTNGRSAINF